MTEGLYGWIDGNLKYKYFLNYCVNYLVYVIATIDVTSLNFDIFVSIIVENLMVIVNLLYY